MMDRTRTAEIWRDDDGTVRVVYEQGVSIDLEDARENLATQLRLRRHGEKLRVLVDTRRVKSISREARACFAGEDAQESSRALALVVESPLSRAAGNFFIGVSKPPFPTKLFNQETAALAWLAEHAG